MSDDELNYAISVLRSQITKSSGLEAFLKKVKNANLVPAREAFTRRVSALFNVAGVKPNLPLDDFARRVFARRNLASHGHAKMKEEPFDALADDTMLLNAAYLAMEAQLLGLDPEAALFGLRGAYLYAPYDYVGVIASE